MTITGDAQARAAGYKDFADYQNKMAQGGSNNGTFNFDYVKAATDAYGELGVYYDRILKESQGDLNLALSRLTEDYDRGVRIKTEDTTTANQATTQSNQANALARGIYQKSLFDPFNQNPATPTAGMGLADLANPNNPYGQTINQSNTNLNRYKEDATITLNRNKVDLPEKQRRYAADLEQQRRTEAASMAETRGQRALTKYQSDQMVLA
jgi:hypothetical protein